MTDRIEQLNQDEAFEAWWDSDPQREMYFPESKGTARAAWHAAVASRPEGGAWKQISTDESFNQGEGCYGLPADARRVIIHRGSEVHYVLDLPQLPPPMNVGGT